MVVSRETGRNVAGLVLLLALQLLLMSLGSREGGGASTVEGATMRLTSPFAAVGGWVGGLVKGVRDDVV